MLNPSKCKILQDEVEYLGHVVTSKGLRPIDHNLDAVRHFPRPNNLKQLRQFLGLTSKLIAGYAKIAHPLHLPTRKGALFNWSAECDTAFDCLRVKLMITPLPTLRRVDVRDRC